MRVICTPGAPTPTSPRRLSHSTQSGAHPHAVRGLDCYSTPACMVEALLRVETLPNGLWEPAAGHGAIVDVLRGVTLDFLAPPGMPDGAEAIITNPPYQIATAFARHALDLTSRVYLLCRLAFLESQRRSDILEHYGLARVLVFRSRLPMMHRHNWAIPRASSAIPFAWFCWDRNHCGPATIERI